jgi:hypothetical protein
MHYFVRGAEAVQLQLAKDRIGGESTPKSTLQLLFTLHSNTRAMKCRGALCHLYPVNLYFLL